MAEREGIEPTRDRNSPTTVLKTAATTRHASLSMLIDLTEAYRTDSVMNVMEN